MAEQALTAASKPAEADDSAAQEPRTGAEAARGSAIARKLAQMPQSCRRNYRRAASGKASPREAIKAQCLQCVGWVREEVRLCTALDCPLWMYRPFKADGEGGHE